jgi:hypothetical protein
MKIFSDVVQVVPIIHTLTWFTLLESQTENMPFGFSKWHISCLTTRACLAAHRRGGNKIGRQFTWDVSASDYYSGYFGEGSVWGLANIPQADIVEITP